VSVSAGERFSMFHVSLDLPPQNMVVSRYVDVFHGRTSGGLRRLVLFFCCCSLRMFCFSSMVAFLQSDKALIVHREEKKKKVQMALKISFMEEALDGFDEPQR
jgi:hypothetical protein